jgi:hypothetical protein
MLCRKGLILTILSLLLVCTLTATTTPNSFTTIQKMNQMPLAFTKNNGQWDDRVLFRANAGGATMWFTKEGVTYQFTRRIDRDTNAFSSHSREGGNPGSVGRTFLSDPGQAGMPILPSDRYEKDSVEQLVLTAKFVDANPNPEIIAEGQIEYKCNYFLGNDQTKWHTDVPNYEAITLRNIYPGIDLKYSGDGNGQAAYEFVVAPGADVAQIKVEYEGAEKTSIDADGRLVLKTKWGDMVAAIKSPVYPPLPLGEGQGVRVALFGSATISQLSEKTIGFEASGASRQALDTRAVGLVYSTCLGGGSGHGIAVDGSGNAYVTGYAWSSNFPTLNPYQGTYQGNGDAFVTKLSSSGNSLIYSTYLGGGGVDVVWDIAVDGSGNAYVTGWTDSRDFPTMSPYQTDQDTTDAFVTKLSNSGNSLIYSTYLGGGDNDYGYGIAVDGSGNAYVTGYTWSSDFPTWNPYQTHQGPAGYDEVFVTKLSSSGASVIYSTYLGGGSAERGNAIAVDGSGYAYVTGFTWSSNFPTKNPYQTYRGLMDVFVTKLSSSGNSLIYSTYLGGGNVDQANGIAVDGGGNAYVTGYTYSSNFPTLNPYQSTYQGGGSFGEDAFVTKLSSTGNSLIYSTYLGGGESDWGWGIVVDGSGNAFVTGKTASSNFPTLNPYQTHQGASYNDDVFVAKLSTSGNTLIYSTYLGGEWYDYGYGIAVDGSGYAYVTGSTESSDFPTLNPYQTYQGGGDAFVTKLRYGAAPPSHISLQPLSLDFSAAQGGSLPNSQTFALSNTGGGTLNWSVSDNASWLDVSPVAGNSNSQTVTVSVNTTNLTNATYNATITVSSNNADNSPQTVSVQYEVYQPMSIVSGQVFDKFTNGMLNGVTVGLWQSGLLKYSAVTNSIGEYGFGTIPSGTYEIRINHPGYYAFTRTDDIVELTEMLAPVFLYDTSHYVSTAELKTALNQFAAAYRTYMDKMGQVVVSTLAYQYQLEYLPKFDAAETGTKQLLNAIPAVGSDLTKTGYFLKNNEDISTKQPDAVVWFLVWNAVESGLGTAKDDYLSYFNGENGVYVPGNEFRDRRLIYSQEHPVESINSIVNEMDVNAGNSLPNIISNTFPLQKVIGQLSLIRNMLLQATPESPDLPPNALIDVYWTLPGSCDLSGARSTILGLINQSAIDIRNRFDESMALHKVTLGVSAVCGSVGVGKNVLQTLAYAKGGTPAEVMKNPVFSASLAYAMITCNLGKYAYATISTIGALNLTVELNTFIQNWPLEFVSSSRFYEGVISDINSAITNPSILFCSSEIDPSASIPAAPDLCIPLGHPSATFSTTCSVRNLSNTKPAKVRLSGGLYVDDGEGGDPLNRQKVSLVNSEEREIGPGQVVSIPLNFEVPQREELWGNDAYKLETILQTSGGIVYPNPVDIHVLSYTCGSVQKFTNTISLLRRKITGGEREIISQSFQANAQAVRGFLRMRYTEGDVDLHLYDGLGNHVGRNYSTGIIELNIPGAKFYGDSTTTEIISLPLTPSAQYTVTAVPVDMVDSVDVAVDLTEVLAAQPEPVFWPDTLFSKVHPGDSVVLDVTLLDRVSQFTLPVASIGLSTLTNGSGDTILTSSWTMTITGQITPGQSARCDLTGIIGDSTRNGEYVGTYQVSAGDSLLSVPIRVEVERGTPHYGSGDANGDSAIDISDVVSLIAYIFSGGSAPEPLEAGDASCDAAVDISDVVYLISYIFSGGPAPCAGCK